MAGLTCEHTALPASADAQPITDEASQVPKSLSAASCGCGDPANWYSPPWQQRLIMPTSSGAVYALPSGLLEEAQAMLDAAKEKERASDALLPMPQQWSQERQEEAVKTSRRDAADAFALFCSVRDLILANGIWLHAGCVTVLWSGQRCPDSPLHMLPRDLLQSIIDLAPPGSHVFGSVRPMPVARGVVGQWQRAAELSICWPRRTSLAFLDVSALEGYLLRCHIVRADSALRTCETPDGRVILLSKLSIFYRSLGQLHKAVELAVRAQAIRGLSDAELRERRVDLRHSYALGYGSRNDGPIARTVHLEGPWEQAEAFTRARSAYTEGVRVLRKDPAAAIPLLLQARRQLDALTGTAADAQASQQSFPWLAGGNTLSTAGACKELEGMVRMHAPDLARVSSTLTPRTPVLSAGSTSARRRILSTWLVRHRTVPLP